MSPKVSILIPVFNRAHFISECIQSALSQTFADIEVVVVDNASTDDTFEICKRLASCDIRLRIFRNETNVGPVRNWKRCAEEAKGEFSKLLFSDDILEPNCVAEMVRSASDSDVAFVYSAALIGDQKKTAKAYYSLRQLESLTPTRFIDLVLLGRAPVSPCAVLLRTCDLRNNIQLNFPTASLRPFGEHGAGPDVMTLFLTAKRYKQIRHIPEPLVYFRAHPGSFSIANSRGEVTKGYRSVFCYFLKGEFGAKAWLRYLSWIWIRELFSTRQIPNSKRLLIEYEGSGSKRERFCLLFEVGVTVIFRIFNIRRSYVN